MQMTFPVKIVSCKIGPYPRPMPQGMADGMPKVTATFEDGSEKELFSFYPDEISFTEKEFKGLTESQARDLKFRKDRDYLKS